MRLHTINGELTLGSAFRMFVVGWIISWGLLFALIAGTILLLALAMPHPTLNSVPTTRAVILREFIPFLIVFPIIIPMQALMMGGLIVGGLSLYRRRRPLLVTNLEESRERP